MPKRIIVAAIFVFLCIDGFSEAGLLTKIRTKRDDKKSSDDNFDAGKFFFGEHGLIPALVSSLNSNKKRSGGETSDPQLDVGRQQSTNATQKPNILDNLGGFFQKLMNGLVTNQNNPNVASDPSIDLDFSKLGLCSKETCGDLYKLVDKFKSSPLYKNMKLLGILLRDKEGLSLLSKILADPELLKSVISGNNDNVAMSLFGLGSGNGTSGNHGPSGSFTGVVSPNRTLSSNASSVDHYYYDLDWFNPQAQARNVSGTTRGPIDYGALYYDHDPKG